MGPYFRFPQVVTCGSMDVLHWRKDFLTYVDRSRFFTRVWSRGTALTISNKLAQWLLNRSSVRRYCSLCSFTSWVVIQKVRTVSTVWDAKYIWRTVNEEDESCSLDSGYALIIRKRREASIKA
jgi:hypothetical protein